jgi:competence protein ComEC
MISRDLTGAREGLDEGDDPAPPLDLRLAVPALGWWAGCLVALWGGADVTSWTAGVGAAVGVAAWLRLRRVAPRWARTIGVTACCLVMAATAATLRMVVDAGTPAYQAGLKHRSAVVDLIVDGIPEPVARNGIPSDRRFRFDATLTGVRIGDEESSATIGLTVYATGDSWSQAAPGSRLTVRGRLGIDTTASWPTVTLATESSPDGDGTASPIQSASWPQRVSHGIRQRLITQSSELEGDASGLVPGIVLGYRGGISPALAQDAKVTGLTHLLAVSGSHFALLCGLLLIPLRRAGPRVAALGGAVLICGLVVLVGPSPSVLRAAVMGAVGLLALLLGRVRSLVPALAAAVLGLLIVDPALADQPGFALSVQATAGIMLLAPPWAAALKRRGWPVGWASLLVVPTVAHLGTMPVIAALSGTVSVWAVPANVFVAPVVAPLLLLGAAAAALSGVWPGLTAVLLELAEPLANWIAWCAHWVAEWPGAVITWPSGATGALLLAVLAVAVPLALRVRRVRLLMVALVAGTAVALIPGQVVRTGWPPPDWLVVGCEIGQGDAFVMATGVPGEAIVVDTGPEPSVIDRCLDRLGVTHVPLVVVSHLHADHVDGLAGVMSDRSVGAVGVGPVHEPAAAWRALRSLATSYSVPVTTLEMGTVLAVGSLSITVLGPDQRRVPPGLGPNDQSAVVMVETAGLRVLFPGDVEEAAQRALVDSGWSLKADVLKLPHHGSAKLLPAFIDAVQPAVVMIGVGAENDFGHPTPYALNLVSKAGVTELLRTDTDGDIATTWDNGLLGTAIRGASPVPLRRRRLLIRRQERVHYK